MSDQRPAVATMRNQSRYHRPTGTPRHPESNGRQPQSLRAGRNPRQTRQTTNRKYHPNPAWRAHRSVAPEQLPEPWASYSRREIPAITRRYTFFPKLVEERKWARPHLGKPFPFMRLPPEIRLQVYRHHLVQDSPIELWPHARNNTTYIASLYRNIAFQHYRRITASLGLLRVSKLINEEASEIFYGHNQFRFTGVNAWMVLDAFIHTIGVHHLVLIRHLTIHVPFPGEDHIAIPRYVHQTYRERICLTHYQTAHFASFLRRHGLCIPLDWKYGDSFARCTDHLSESAHLRTLKLVLPPTFYIWRGKANGKRRNPLFWFWRRLYSVKCTLDADREAENRVKPHFGFVFLKLHERMYNVSGLANHELLYPWMMRYIGQTKRILEDLRQTGWIEAIEYGAHDKDGNYELVDRESCEKLVGKMSMRLEELDEDSQVIGHDGKDWVRFD